MVTKIIVDELRCDNEGCGNLYKIKNKTDLSLLIDTPCPKCGQNMLSQQDYANTQCLKLATEMVNDFGIDGSLLVCNCVNLMKQIIDANNLIMESTKGKKGVSARFNTHGTVSIREMKLYNIKLPKNT